MPAPFQLSRTSRELDPLHNKRALSINGSRDSIRQKIETLYHSNLSECELRIPRMINYSSKDELLPSFRKKLRSNLYNHKDYDPKMDSQFGKHLYQGIFDESLAEKQNIRTVNQFILQRKTFQKAIRESKKAHVKQGGIFPLRSKTKTNMEDKSETALPYQMSILKSRRHLYEHYKGRIKAGAFTREKLMSIQKSVSREMKKHEPNQYLEKPLGFEQFERLADKLKKESPVKVNQLEEETRDLAVQRARYYLKFGENYEPDLETQSQFDTVLSSKHFSKRDQLMIAGNSLTSNDQSLSIAMQLQESVSSDQDQAKISFIGNDQKSPQSSVLSNLRAHVMKRLRMKSNANQRQDRMQKLQLLNHKAPKQMRLSSPSKQMTASNDNLSTNVGSFTIKPKKEAMSLVISNIPSQKLNMFQGSKFTQVKPLRNLLKRRISTARQGQQKCFFSQDFGNSTQPPNIQRIQQKNRLLFSAKAASKYTRVGKDLGSQFVSRDSFRESQGQDSAFSSQDARTRMSVSTRAKVIQDRGSVPFQGM